MATEAINRTNAPLRFSWISYVIGIIMLAIGVMGFFMGKSGLMSMKVWFMAGLLLCGVLDIFHWVFNRQQGGGIFTLILGSVQVILGLFLMFLSPVKLAGSMNLIVGGWILLCTLWSLIQYFKLRRETEGTLFLVIMSAAGLIFAALFMIMSSANVLYLWIAILAYAIARVLYGMKVKKLYPAREN